MRLVRIVEDSNPEDTGKVDHHGKAIVHSFLIVDVDTREVLGKYRDKETVTVGRKKLVTDEKNKPILDADGNEQLRTVFEEKTLNGRQCATRAAAANGWKVTTIA